MNRLALICVFSLSAVYLPAAEVDYDRDIKPLLRTKCAACHGALKQESGLRLDAGKLIHRGGDGGDVIDLKDTAASAILERVASEDPDIRMPPEGQGEAMDADQIALLAAWIRGGATYPADEAIPAAPSEHWAYQVPRAADVPNVAVDGETITHPIDAFLLGRLSQAELKPVPLADRRMQLRRVYLDLIGLPPTPAEQQAFESDPSPAAWDRVVDRLLDDPAHGERWARHWMDIWRYSDWDGYKNELRGSQRHIWRWREWIIQSLNEDKPYDRMIAEMLAGDELAPDDLHTLRATGFLARNFHKSNRNIWLDATVEHTAKAFLGMTINCARCHDHKYDPIGQREYYTLRAIFEPHNVRTEQMPGESDLNKQGLVRAYDAKPDEKTFLYIGGNEKLPDKEHPLTAAMPEILGLPFEPQPVELPPVAVYPALREYIEQEQVAAAEAKAAAAAKKVSEQKESGDESSRELAIQNEVAAKAELAALKARWKAERAKYKAEGDAKASEDLARQALRAERQANLERARHRVLVEKSKWKPPEAITLTDDVKPASEPTDVEESPKPKELLEAEKQLAKAEEAAKDADATNYTPVGKAYPRVSTGRRSALARWITDRSNPLAARVAVNHIWLRHFGEPLVANVFDFGLRSPRPEHAELLDWLAVELMNNDWSMKHVHRLIVTSAAYRRASSAPDKQFAANQERDPDNLLYWRANIQRLDAEVVRDSVLHVAGRLDRKMGGPDIDFNQGETVLRRSVYFRHAYEKQMRMLVVFDAAGPTECYRRSESIVPQQALALANSKLVIESARRLAATLNESAADDPAFIRSAIETVLCRKATDNEVVTCEDFLDTQTKRLANANELTPVAGKAKTSIAPAAEPRQRARENLVHVLLNLNDFVMVR